MRTKPKLFSLLLVISLMLQGMVMAQVPADSSRQRFQDSVRARIISSPLDTVRTEADKTGEKKNSLVISVELRTRTEFRRGYKAIPTSDTTPAFFTAQRTRLNFAYGTKGLNLFLSLQDARVWGTQDPRNPLQPGYLFEAWAEPHFSGKLSIRVGRQRLEYDNQRLFAENDWRTQGQSHDAMRFIYNNKINFTTELTAAYNQSAENTFGTNYKPSGFVNYKDLVVHYLNWKVTKNFTVTTINAMDGYQSPVMATTTYNRFTSGGRIEYASYNWYLTFAGYYQYGKDSAGRTLKAFYYQPEMRYTGFKNITLRGGIEYLSGDNALEASNTDHNFVTLYGTAHRFMGNLDFFTSFPGDVNRAGLVNPYLFIWWAKGKWAVRFDHHLFYSQNNFLSDGKTMDKYLGYENDWRVNFKPVNYIDAEFGFCWAAVTPSMVAIKKSGDAGTTPYWMYLSLRFTPTIGKFSF